MTKKSTEKSNTSEPESTSYVVGQVSGCLFPNKSATGSGSLSALFSTNTATANTVVFVPAPKPEPTPVLPKAAPAQGTVDVKVQPKENKKAKSAAELKVQDRESALQTADDEDSGTAKGPKKGAKRKAAKVDDDEDAVGHNGRPAKRKMTFKDYAAERVKLNRTVFVGNLPVSCTREKLRAIFKEHGPIESMRFRSVVGEDPSISHKLAAIQRKVHQKKQSINAYIVFKETEAALDALKKNGLEIQKDFYIRVDKVSSKQHDHKRSIFVGNLPYDVAELSLRQHFQDCGEVEAVRLIRDRNTGMGKGFGYVLFESGDSVQLALKLDGSVLCERKIRVKRSVKDGKGAGGGGAKEGGKGLGKGKKGLSGPASKGQGPMKKGPKGGPPKAFPKGGGGNNKKGFQGGKPGKKTPPSSFKGEMADPAAKKHKGQKKKKPKPKQKKKANVHFG